MPVSHAAGPADPDQGHRVEDPMYQKSATACGDGSKAGMDAINFLQAIDFTPDFAKKIESLLYKIPESSQLIDA